jgi:hypothetical protein
MNDYGVLEQKRSASDVHWWKTGRSLSEIAEHLECALADNQALELRVAELLEENRKLSLRCSETASELTSERERSKAEISDLRSQVADGLKRLQEKSIAGGRQHVQQATRERLMKEECERKVQALQLQLNKERHRHAKEIGEMEQDLASCFCKHVRIDHVERNDLLGSSAALPAGWQIRNAK